MITRLFLIVPVAIALALSGCAGAGTSPAKATRTNVAAAQVALMAAEKLATTYATLPQCPAQAPVCSDAATIAKIKADDNTAYSAVKAARRSNSDADLALANAAIAALVSAVPSPAVPSSH